MFLKSLKMIFFSYIIRKRENMKEKIKIYDELRELLPLQRNDNEDFIDFINHLMKGYREKVESHYENNDNFKRINDVIEILPTLFQLMGVGQKEKAYNTFKEKFEELICSENNEYSGVLPIYNRDYDTFLELSESLNKYFRITNYKNSIIHLPLDLKGKYEINNRFTDAMWPCFYGGNTIQVCLDEIGNSEVNGKFISCFELEYSRLGILDLTMPTFVVKERNETDLDKYILSWPIVALCMVRRNNSKSEKFVPEYTISQFILKILAENNLKLDAVRYYSTKQQTLNDNYINIAIPVKSNRNNGYCEELLSVFKDEDRDPNNPNYLRITRPKLLSDLSSHNENLINVENVLINNLSYQNDLISSDFF
jgi:RES domain